MKNLKLPSQTFFLILFSLTILISFKDFSQDNEVDFIPILFDNEGSNISGKFFKAVEGQVNPTVILIHGYPGREGDIFGIGSFLKNNGINVFVFNYRGAWKSEGLFSIENAISDVIKSVAFLKLPEISKKYNVDTTDIILVGYSLGGGIALISGKMCPSVKKIISVATTNLKIIADHIEADSIYRKSHLQALENGLKVVHSNMTAEDIHIWLSEHKNEIDLINSVDELSTKKILLIGGWNDNLTPIEEHTIPLYRFFQKKLSDCKMVLLEANHSFSNSFPDIQKNILHWIKN